MKKLSLIYLIILMYSFGCKQEKSDRSDFPSATALIQRVLLEKANQFIIDSIPQENNKDVFEIESKNGKIILRGSSVPSVGYALNFYLKYYCNCQFSQAGQNMNLPEELPQVKEKVRNVTPFQYRYYLNYCTYNYQMSFWDWTKWEKELDWMALNGINMALSIKGMEAVWQNTLRQFNFSENDILNFIPGPAFQAWWLMGNLEGWGGQVSQEWINQELALGQKIIKRMHELGITPLFHGFYGMVPIQLKDKYPAADIIKGGDWCSFDRPDFLNPQDSLFSKMANVYYSEMDKLFGKTIFYGGDPFHEGGNTKGIDITKASVEIQSAMLKNNPDAIWVLQGWIDNPKDELLNGIDRKKIIVLDLFNDGTFSKDGKPTWEVRKSYNDSPFIWCIVGNFGGRTGLYGKLNIITDNLSKAIHSEYKKNLKGIGIMPESNRLNPLIFDYIYELAWHGSNLLKPEDWVLDYSTYRYGKKSEKAQKAWGIINDEIYNIPMLANHDEPQPVYLARPSLNVKSVAPWGMCKTFYNQKKLIEAVNLLFECSDEFKNVDSYLYDIVDFTRQSLYVVGEENYNAMLTAYKNNDKKTFNIEAEKFLKLIKDVDRLMSTRKEFLMGKWISDAKSLASNAQEKALFERNARLLVTTWGQDHDPNILIDYAHREWAGLISSYYLPRWEAYIKYLNEKLDGKSAIEINFLKWEEKWANNSDILPTETQGNALIIAKEIFEEYTK